MISSFARTTTTSFPLIDMSLTYSPLTIAPYSVLPPADAELTVPVASYPHPTTVDIIYSIDSSSHVAFVDNGARVQQITTRGTRIDVTTTLIVRRVTLARDVDGTTLPSFAIMATVTENAADGDQFTTVCWPVVPQALHDKATFNVINDGQKATATILPFGGSETKCAHCGSRKRTSPRKKRKSSK